MMLQLTKRGDYAVRSMLALADADGSLVTGEHIARSTGVPRSFLPQVMGDLVHAGLVVGLQGRLGGYRLAQEADKISLLAIVEAVEGDSRRMTCILRGGSCGAQGRHCRVHDAFFAGQDALLNVLASATLGRLASARGDGTGPR